MPEMNTLEVAKAIQDLGIVVVLANNARADSFLPGVWMEFGRLHVCPRFCQPGDLLHEAAHLALVPSRFRYLAGPGTIESGPLVDALVTYMMSQEARDNGPDHPLIRGILQMGEHEAQAWAFAAAYRIGFDTKQAFCFRYDGVPDDHQPYAAEGEEVWRGLVHKQNPGINGLQAGGLCSRRDYPNMIKWTQD